MVPTPPPAELAPFVGAVVTAAAQALPWLLAAGAFATLRTALQRSHPDRTAQAAPDAGTRARLEPLLHESERLATSAGVFEVTSRAAFGVMLLKSFAQGRPVSVEVVVETVAVAVPALLIAADALPHALALRRGDAILARLLPAFHAFQLPLRWLIAAYELVRRAFRRVFGLADADPAARRIVEGLREVIEEAEPSRDLDEATREIIGNVIEFRDASVSELMTPRTEICGVDVNSDVGTAARVAAECAHSRIPVYEESLDSIVGFVTARDLVRSAAEGTIDTASLRSLLRPAFFVPETKRVADLLADFRREKAKIAIVLDEYGGTAGLVTLGDVLEELVGDVEEEATRQGGERVRRLPDGSAEVDASLHVSEVNEELGTSLPESEEYDTLAGLVLAALGRFPKRGEKLVRDGVEIRVVDASDRRVLKLALKPVAAEAALAERR